jgi:hypothetical protein
MASGSKSMPSRKKEFPPHIDAYRKALSTALGALSEEHREQILADRRTRRTVWLKEREAKDARQRRIMELALCGYPHWEIADLVGVTRRTIITLLNKSFPFPHPGRNNRYVTVRLSPTDLPALDRLREDMAPRRDRGGALEAITEANLEQDAFVARRTLRVVRPAP